MSGATLPSVFIASSSERLGVANDVQELLEYDCHATVWNQGVFRPSDTVLQRLTRSLRDYEFGLFVFTADDRLHLRGDDVLVVRDNVIFEMGLFGGALGAERCFHLVPRGQPALHLPSDLLGVLGLDYPIDRPDRNRLAALSPACNKMRRILREQRSVPGPTPQQNFDRFAAAWNASPLVDDRALLSAGIVMDPYDEGFPRKQLWRVFGFLESMADAVLSGQVPEPVARAAFGAALVVFWPQAVVLLAPPNHRSEAWDPLPRIAELYARWR